MADAHKIVFVTARSSRHQASAIAAAPPDCQVTMLRQPDPVAFARELADAEFLISERAGVIGRDLIEAGPGLRLIQRLGSLTYDIDVGAARAAGIPVCSMPVYGSVMVAEHMLMQMLALAKRLPEVSAIAQAAESWGRPSRRTDENVFAYNWSGRTGARGVYEATVGILGFGEIGAELARRLRPYLPARVLYQKRQRLPEAVEAELGITYAEWHTVIAESEFLCVLLPYAPETDMALNAQTLATMKPGACIVSCGSGSVIDEAALADAIRRGHLSGAALDTYEWEPLRPDNPLLPLALRPEANVLLTPHTAAGTGTPGKPGRSADYENVRRILQGEPLLYRVA